MSTHAENRARETVAEPITMTFSVTLEAIVEPEADGGYSASVPSLPGCGTEADDLETLRANLIDAAEGWLATKREIVRRRGRVPLAPRHEYKSPASATLPQPKREPL